MNFDDPYGTWPFPKDWPASPDGLPLLEEDAIAQVIASRKAAYEGGEGASTGNLSYAQARARADALGV